MNLCLPWFKDLTTDARGMLLLPALGLCFESDGSLRMCSNREYKGSYALQNVRSQGRHLIERLKKERMLAFCKVTFFPRCIDSEHGAHYLQFLKDGEEVGEDVCSKKW